MNGVTTPLLSPWWTQWIWTFREDAEYSR